MARAWLLLIYSVPTKPTRIRWHVWREIRRTGAVLLRDGVAVLPRGERAATWMHDVAQMIRAGGGKVQVATARFPALEERHLLRAFEEDRAREYDEIVDSCGALLEHVDREASHAEFTFAELAELEADLDKIRRWLEAAGGRDYFKSPSVKRAERTVERCEQKIARFAERTGRAELRSRAPRRAARSPRARSA